MWNISEMILEKFFQTPKTLSPKHFEERFKNLHLGSLTGAAVQAVL